MRRAAHVRIYDSYATMIGPRQVVVSQDSCWSRGLVLKLDGVAYALTRQAVGELLTGLIRLAGTWLKIQMGGRS